MSFVCAKCECEMTTEEAVAHPINCLTDFEKKRLSYMIRAAANYEWVRLGPGDVDTIKKLLENK